MTQGFLQTLLDLAFQGLCAAESGRLKDNIATGNKGFNTRKTERHEDLAQSLHLEGAV